MTSTKVHSSTNDDYLSWTWEQVLQWAGGLNFGNRYVDVFKDHEVNGRTLSNMTFENLKSDFGMTSSLIRKNLLRQIGRINSLESDGRSPKIIYVCSDSDSDMDSNFDSDSSWEDESTLTPPSSSKYRREMEVELQTKKVKAKKIRQISDTDSSPSSDEQPASKKPRFVRPNKRASSSSTSSRRSKKRMTIESFDEKSFIVRTVDPFLAVQTKYFNELSALNDKINQLSPEQQSKVRAHLSETAMSHSSPVMKQLLQLHPSLKLHQSLPLNPFTEPDFRMIPKLETGGRKAFKKCKRYPSDTPRRKRSSKATNILNTREKVARSVGGKLAGATRVMGGAVDSSRIDAIYKEQFGGTQISAKRKHHLENFPQHGWNFNIPKHSDINRSARKKYEDYIRTYLQEFTNLLENMNEATLLALLKDVSDREWRMARARMYRKNKNYYFHESSTMKVNVANEKLLADINFFADHLSNELFPEQVGQQRIIYWIITLHMLLKYQRDGTTKLATGVGYISGIESQLELILPPGTADKIVEGFKTLMARLFPPTCHIGARISDQVHAWEKKTFEEYTAVLRLKLGEWLTEAHVAQVLLDADTLTKLDYSEKLEYPSKEDLDKHSKPHAETQHDNPIKDLGEEPNFQCKREKDTGSQKHEA